MAHKPGQPYSGKNPVPTIATKLTALVNPEAATEAKAQQLQDQSARNEEKQTEKTASRLAKGREMHVTDPTTGEELNIRNAAEDVNKSSKGDNVLHQEFPQPGKRSFLSLYALHLPLRNPCVAREGRFSLELLEMRCSAAMFQILTHSLRLERTP